MKTSNLKDALKKLVLSESSDSATLFEEVQEHLKTLQPPKTVGLHRGRVKSVKKLRTADNEYVYDIGMKNESKPWFFGNNILIHNSVYFSAVPIFKDQIASGEIDWSTDKIISLYDAISDQVNDTFPTFMNVAFNAPTSQGDIIKAGRELVASKGIFITKKRYAVLIVDKEGKRKDTNGSKGEVKAMGLDMKRADTPDFMQKFLEEALTMTLEGVSERDVMARVLKFREEFKSRPGWEKGTPKRVNNLTKHTEVYKKTGKCGVGHAMAAINWNRFKESFGDRHSMDITDGQKAIVCKLRSNNYNITSIAYPIDEMNLPDWFKQLPFDHTAMEETIIDSKIDNLLGVLHWDLNASKEQSHINDIFS